MHATISELPSIKITIGNNNRVVDQVSKYLLGIRICGFRSVGSGSKSLKPTFESPDLDPDSSKICGNLTFFFSKNLLTKLTMIYGHFDVLLCKIFIISIVREFLFPTRVYSH